MPLCVFREKVLSGRRLTVIAGSCRVTRLNMLGEYIVVGAMFLAVAIAVVVMRRRARIEPAVAHGAQYERTPEDEEDERATTMQLDFVLYDNGKRVAADTIVLTDEHQEKFYDVGSAKYVIGYQFGRPTCAISVKAPSWDAGLAMPPYRTPEEEEIALGLTGSLSYNRKPIVVAQS